MRSSSRRSFLAHTAWVTLGGAAFVLAGCGSGSGSRNLTGGGTQDTTLASFLGPLEATLTDGRKLSLYLEGVGDTGVVGTWLLDETVLFPSLGALAVPQGGGTLTGTLDTTTRQLTCDLRPYTAPAEATRQTSEYIISFFVIIAIGLGIYNTADSQVPATVNETASGNPAPSQQVTIKRPNGYVSSTTPAVTPINVSLQNSEINGEWNGTPAEREGGLILLNPLTGTPIRADARGPLRIVYVHNPQTLSAQATIVAPDGKAFTRQASGLTITSDYVLNEFVIPSDVAPVSVSGFTIPIAGRTLSMRGALSRVNGLLTQTGQAFLNLPNTDPLYDLAPGSVVGNVKKVVFGSFKIEKRTIATAPQTGGIAVPIN